jgi:GWxTD domain-containing protein
MSHRIRFCFLLLLALFARTAQALDLGVSYAVMATPANPYIEINLEIDPLTISWPAIEGDSTRFQASAEVLILIKKGENIVAYEKYMLNSPILEYYGNLLDVKRLAVPNGDYVLEVTATDKALPKNMARFSRPIKVEVGDQLYMSDIQFLRGYKSDSSTTNPFVKFGQYLEPMPFAYYDRNAVNLAFFTEIYHSNKAITDPTYTVRFIIERDLGNGEYKLVSLVNQKKKPSVLDVVQARMDISLFESGNYKLTIELRNKANEVLLARQMPFQRSNPFLNMDEAGLSKETVSKQFVQTLDEKALRYSLRALSPNVVFGSEPEELKNILQGSDLDAMRFFLFRYFVREAPTQPEAAYRAYIETANAADKQFHSGFRYGFETDRGRVYMRYGRPDDLISVSDDPAAPPYEIWVYYNFPKTKQRNVKFLFYNPSLAGDDYITLHSTARGEINNPKWEIALYKRNAGNEFEGDNEWDATNMQRNANRNARVYFEDY